MELLEDALKKKVYGSLYAILFLTSLLGISVLLESCHKKRELKFKSLNKKEIVLTDKDF